MATSDVSQIIKLQRRVQTTDATVTTAADYTLPDECAAIVSYKVIGIQSGAANTGGYAGNVLVEAQSGTRAIVGTGTGTLTAEDTAAWDCAVDVSGNDVRVRVTGVAATTIDWQTTMEITLFKP